MALGWSQTQLRPQQNVWRPRTLRERLLVAQGHKENRTGNALLARYLEGWAEANPAKILDAVTPNYHFPGSASRRVHQALAAAIPRHSASALRPCGDDHAAGLRVPTARSDGRATASGSASVLAGSPAHRAHRHCPNRVYGGRRDRRKRGLRPQPGIRPLA